MKTHVRLNLDVLTASTTLPELFHFLNCENVKNSNINFTSITINPSFSGDFQVDNIWFTRTSVKTISIDETYVEFDCNIDLEFDDILSMMNIGLLSFDVSGYTSLFVFKQNSENDMLEKNLSLQNIITGKFNHAINLKNVNVDIQSFGLSFNYVWIPSLKRYYYVDSVELISADYSRLHLREDVLMTWKALIKQQRAFVTRYENALNKHLVDNRKPVEDCLSIDYGTIQNTQNGLVNTTINFNVNPSNFMYMISSISAEYPALTRDAVIGPTDSALPNVNNIYPETERIVFLNQVQAGLFYESLNENDAVASYISSVILLPFNADGGSYGTLQNSVLYAGKYVLTNSGFYEVGHIPAGSNVIILPTYNKNGSPYFVVYDFTYTAEDTYLNREPYKHVEFFIPFLGWIPLQIAQIINKRLIVYYTLDHVSGSGTAYIYNMTDQKLIYSSNCQFGIKMPLITSNALEIERQKEASQLNLIMGMLTSALSVGVGVATENPVAVAGGILSAGKTIASFVNTNKQLFERGQTNFGTGEGLFHTPLSVNIVVRTTYNNPVLINESTYKHMQGYPYNNYVYNMTSLTGYVEIGEIHFDPKGEDIYQDEISEIVELLQNGVIF